MDIIILIISLLLLYRGKLAWVFLGLLALTTSYLGAGTNLSTFPVTHNVSDSGLILYIALLLYILKKNNGKLKKSSIGKYLTVFYIFLLISIFIDIELNHINLISIIKTTRHWIYLSCIFIFYYIPTEEVEKLFIYLLRATAIISGIILTEYLTGIKIIGIRTVNDVTETGQEFLRGAIPSTFTLFFLILLISNYFKFNRKIKSFYIILLTAVLLASMIRSMLIALAISILMIYLLKEKLKIKNILLSIAALTILMTIIVSIPLIRQRFMSGFEDMATLNVDGDINGNFSYRIFHLVERINYISHKPQYSIFGIGNIDESNFPQVFSIGIRDISGKIWQIVSPDIAWSTLFLRLGYLGTFIYILFYFSTFRVYRFCIQSPLALTLFIYLFVSLALISFVSWDIAQGQFMLLPMLAYFYITKKTDENHSNNIAL